MSIIINLTQHAASAEQQAAGVVDLDPICRRSVAALLTFDELPSVEDIKIRATSIAQIAAIVFDQNEESVGAMIGGAMWLMAPLAEELRRQGIAPMFAFSKRESGEETQPDGSVRKVNVFRHTGFVPAL